MLEYNIQARYIDRKFHGWVLDGKGKVHIINSYTLQYEDVGSTIVDFAGCTQYVHKILLQPLSLIFQGDAPGTVINNMANNHTEDLFPVSSTFVIGYRPIIITGHTYWVDPAQLPSIW